jgi:hypothetical protein
MTHLRLRPRDARRIRTDKLKAIPGVLGALEAAGEFRSSWGQVVWPGSSSRSFPTSWLAASNAALYAFQDQLQGTVLIGLLSAIS